MYGQSNISNVSEVSLKYLFSQTDNKAQKTIQSLTDGMFKRFEYFRKLQELRGIHKKYTDEAFDSLNIHPQDKDDVARWKCADRQVML